MFVLDFSYEFTSLTQYVRKRKFEPDTRLYLECSIFIKFYKMITIGMNSVNGLLCGRPFGCEEHDTPPVRPYCNDFFTTSQSPLC